MISQSSLSSPLASTEAYSTATQVPSLHKERNGGTGDLFSYAKEFEAVLLGQWLQSAESSFGTVDGQSDDGDAGGEQMKSFGIQALAKELSQRGGIGISSTIAHALQSASEATPLSQKSNVSR